MGILTHDIFWGSVLYFDDISDFIYNHLVKEISSKEALESKLSYDKVFSYRTEERSKATTPITFV